MAECGVAVSEDALVSVMANLSGTRSAAMCSHTPAKSCCCSKSLIDTVAPTAMDWRLLNHHSNADSSKNYLCSDSVPSPLATGIGTLHYYFVTLHYYVFNNPVVSLSVDEGLSLFVTSMGHFFFYSLVVSKLLLLEETDHQF